MNKRIIFIGIIVLLFATTAVTFSRNSASATISINAAGETSGEAAEAQGVMVVDDGILMKYSTGAAHPYTQHAPTWAPVVDQAGSVTAGDVYYIDCDNYTGDILVTLFLTNVDELSKDYSYLNLKVNVWDDASGNWAQATLADGTAIGTMYLTLTNGFTTFVLNGYTHYCLSVDGGTYYCIDTDAVGGSLSPSFYVEIKPV